MNMISNPNVCKFKMPNRIQRIQALLSSLQLESCQIIDESQSHAAHYPEAAHEATHIQLVLKGTVFEGKTRVMQHKIIHDLLKDEFATGLHALSIKIIPTISQA